MILKKHYLNSCIFRIKFIQVSGVIFDARTQTVNESQVSISLFKFQILINEKKLLCDVLNLKQLIFSCCSWNYQSH